MVASSGYEVCRSGNLVRTGILASSCPEIAVLAISSYASANVICRCSHFPIIFYSLASENSGNAGASVHRALVPVQNTSILDKN